MPTTVRRRRACRRAARRTRRPAPRLSTSAVTPRDASASTSAFFTTPRSCRARPRSRSRSRAPPRSGDAARREAGRRPRAPAAVPRRAARAALRRSSTGPTRCATTCGDDTPRPTRRVGRSGYSRVSSPSRFGWSRRTSNGERMTRRFSSASITRFAPPDPVSRRSSHRCALTCSTRVSWRAAHGQRGSSDEDTTNHSRPR